MSESYTYLMCNIKKSQDIVGLQMYFPRSQARDRNRNILGNITSGSSGFYLLLHNTFKQYKMAFTQTF